MIRVNLLPQAGERRGAPESSQLWLLVVVGVVVAEVVGLFFFHQTREDELDKVSQEVAQLDTQIADINALVKDHAKVKEELKSLRAREDAIAKLQSGRKGPTAVMLELSKVLTRGKGPTADAETLAQKRQQNPLDVFNPSWDTRRVWLTKVLEEERNVRLEGLARDGGDVYEFATRLKLSQYVESVELLPGEQEKQQQNQVELVKFALQVKVRY